MAKCSFHRFRYIQCLSAGPGQRAHCPGGAGGRVGSVRPRPARPAGDAGEADPAVTAILAAYAVGEATERAVLTAVAASRLLVPIVAVLAAANEDGTEKETEMALPTLIGNDGRAAVIAFTSSDTLRSWRRDARPVAVAAARLWAAALTEADAVVVDIAGRSRSWSRARDCEGSPPASRHRPRTRTPISAPPSPRSHPTSAWSQAAPTPTSPSR